MKKREIKTEKYKGSLQTTRSNYMPIKWTTQKKLTNSWKGTTFQNNQEELENISKPITSNEIDTVIKNLPKIKSPGPDGLTGEFWSNI